MAENVNGRKRKRAIPAVAWFDGCDLQEFLPVHFQALQLLTLLQAFDQDQTLVFLCTQPTPVHKMDRTVNPHLLPFPCSLAEFQFFLDFVAHQACNRPHPTIDLKVIDHLLHYFLAH